MNAAFAKQAFMGEGAAGMPPDGETERELNPWEKQLRALKFLKKIWKVGLQVPVRQKEAKKKIIRGVDVIYPTVIIVDVSVKRFPKSVSDFLLLGLRII